ncbi:hypothetical protein NR798_33780 [Archangium gephyra]|uniref:hypothetical protein n=1 Tax=Archangium gephyra TaxID=48 RepID=UPI0035D51E47
MLEQVILFLLFIGAAQVVNRLAKRPVMNGAAWYLVAAVIVYTSAFDRDRLALNAQSQLTETMRLKLLTEMMLRHVRNMLLPACVAIYYARKFSKAKAAAASHLSART